jgi:hypothetical protein
MSNFAEWHRVEYRRDNDEEAAHGPLPRFVDAVLDAVGPDVIAGSRNRLRALGCALLGGVAAFAEDRVTRLPARELRRFAVGTLGRAARLPGDDVESLIAFCQYAVDPPVRKSEEELSRLIAKYPDLDDDIRRDAEAVAAFLDDPQHADPAWRNAFDVGGNEFTDWWENPDIFSSKRVVKAITSAPPDRSLDI